jgi:hypothetical protein
VDALRQAGCLVLQLDAFDLLVFRRGKFFMFDAKTGQGPRDVGPRAVNCGGMAALLRPVGLGGVGPRRRKMLKESLSR